MKTITIELDVFRDHVDEALTEAEQGELILTRKGKPWIVMRPASNDQAVEVSSESRSRPESERASHRPDEAATSLIGKTVAWTRAHFEKVYNASLGAMAFVDGKEVPEDHVLKEGEVIEFADEAEDEEWAVELHRSPKFWETMRQPRREGTIPWDEVKRRLELDETEAVGLEDETQPARVGPPGSGATS